MDEGQHCVFYHCARSEIISGTILEKSKNIEGIYMFQVSYVDGNKRLIDYVAPKDLIKFDP